MKNIFIKVCICLGIACNVIAQASEPDSLSFVFGEAVSGDKLTESVQIIPNNTLYGHLKGLYVMQGVNNTNPLESSASLNLRGKSTFGNDGPMILIDGFERSLSHITSEEIESVQVLSDAIASAIYGVRGANGVVLITTKEGQKGNHTEVNYDFIVNTPFRMQAFADAATYAESYDEARINDGLTPLYTDKLDYYRNGNEPEAFPNVDWQDWAYKSLTNSHLVNIQNQGGTDRFNYYTIVNYSNSSSLIDFKNYDERYNTGNNRVNLNVRSNINVDITNSTHLKLNVMARLVQNKRPGTDLSSLYNKLYNTPANAFPVKTSNDLWGGNSFLDYNPIGEIADRGYIKDFRRTINTNLHIKQDLDKYIDGLYAEAAIAYDDQVQLNDARKRNYAREEVFPLFTSDGELVGASYQTLGLATELAWSSNTSDMYSRSAIEGALGYDMTQGDHSLSAKLQYRQTAYMGQWRNSTMKRQDIMAIANYGFQGKYFADAVVNYSGTAVLPEGDQFNTYPALGLGWLLSEEDFLKDNNIINYLKLKTTVGLSGNDFIGHDLHKQYYGIRGGGYLFGNNNTSFGGIQEGNLAIADLKVEKARKFDFTAEATLLKNINVSATYFNELRSDILVSGWSVVSSMIGIGVPQLCTGEVKNQGVELNLQYYNTIGDLSFGVDANYTFAKNEIINNNEGFQPEEYLYTTGNSLGQYYGLQNEGFFNSQTEIDNYDVFQALGGTLSPGDVKYKDQNGDKVVDENDYVHLGYGGLPEIYYGFNVHLAYKNFGMNALFQGVAHRNVYQNTTSLHKPLTNNTNISSWYLDENVHWTPATAQEANLPRLTTLDNPNNFAWSDLWMANGNYLKLRNVQFFYDLNLKSSNKMTARLYLNGSNLFSIDNLKTQDPENIGANYPTTRAFSAGVQVNF